MLTVSLTLASMQCSAVRMETPAEQKVETYLVSPRSLWSQKSNSPYLLRRENRLQSSPYRRYHAAGADKRRPKAFMLLKYSTSDENEALIIPPKSTKMHGPALRKTIDDLEKLQSSCNDRPPGDSVDSKVVKLPNQQVITDDSVNASWESDMTCQAYAVS